MLDKNIAANAFNYDSAFTTIDEVLSAVPKVDGSSSESTGIAPAKEDKTEKKHGHKHHEHKGHHGKHGKHNKLVHALLWQDVGAAPILAAKHMAHEIMHEVGKGEMSTAQTGLLKEFFADLKALSNQKLHDTGALPSDLQAIYDKAIAKASTLVPEEGKAYVAFLESAKDEVIAEQAKAKDEIAKADPTELAKAKSLLATKDPHEVALHGLKEDESETSDTEKPSGLSKSASGTSSVSAAKKSYAKYYVVAGVVVAVAVGYWYWEKKHKK